MALDLKVFLIPFDSLRLTKQIGGHAVIGARKLAIGAQELCSWRGLQDLAQQAPHPAPCICH